MQKSICLILTIFLTILILACLSAWIYSKDMLFLGVGVLLTIALILVGLELKKIKKDPFS